MGLEIEKEEEEEAKQDTADDVLRAHGVAGAIDRTQDPLRLALGEEKDGMDRYEPVWMTDGPIQPKSASDENEKEPVDENKILKPHPLSDLMLDNDTLLCAYPPNRAGG